MSLRDLNAHSVYSTKLNITALIDPDRKWGFRQFLTTYDNK